MKTLNVIVPCYNEALVIRETYERLSSVLKTLDGVESTITFIDDGSWDGTPDILREIGKTDASVRIIGLSRNFGHQAAVTAGINHCTADMAVIIDADLQDPPEIIPGLIRCKEEQDANVVYCVRKKREGEGLFKKLSAGLFYRLLNSLTEVKFPVDTGDFRLIDACVIGEFNKLHERGKYIRGLISWIGFKQVPFYYERHARFAGETKYPLKRMLRFAMTALLYFSKKPLQIALALGFLAILVGLVLACWYFFGKLFGFTHAESGFTSTMILIIFFGGVQLLTIGALGQYIGVLFDEIKGRPEYIIKDRINFNK
ncbi:MAG: glycosyltransferase family 2 protein [Mediterranea sp.]|jgi:dolichol-phosphate mannosyltransferase|nr:glycosyltransferase family 2 protein [Mediterranea sp.]